MEKLKEIINICKASVTISINDHKDLYTSVENYMKDEKATFEISERVLNEMVEKDTIVRIQCYPNTPVGFFVVFHHDIEAALESVYKRLKGTK